MKCEKPWLKYPIKLLESHNNPYFKEVSSYATLAPILKSIRRKLFEQATPQLGTQNSAIFMKGGCDVPVYDSDCDYEFMQEPYFKYLFGVDEPNILGIYHLQTQKTIIFIKKYDLNYQRVMGPGKDPKWYKENFAIDEVHYEENFHTVLKEKNIQTLHIMNNNSDSDSKLPYPLCPKNDSFLSSSYPFSVLNSYTLDDTKLHSILTELRVRKTTEELNFLRKANAINCYGHYFLMKVLRPGLLERQIESLFKGYIGFAGGNRSMLHYGAIVASGTNSATLHYGHAASANDKTIEKGDLVLIDLGGIFQGYGTDLTCTLPASGKYSVEQKKVYDIVLKAHDSVIEGMKPGVNWFDLHRRAERVIMEGLDEIGVLRVKGKSEEEKCSLIEKGLMAVFFPHGLGHFLGLRTHDVGGFCTGYGRSGRVGLTYCRTGRNLEEGMYITVEPGCYFIPFLLEQARLNEELAGCIDFEECKKYVGMGGVRIESNVAVTQSGSENFTCLPRTTEDIEEVMASPLMF